jgi:hypothetical protein
MITGRPIKRTQGRVVPPAEPVNIAWQLTACGWATRQTKLTWETGLVVMFRLYGASARSARARRTYDRIMDA